MYVTSASAQTSTVDSPLTPVEMSNHTQKRTRVAWSTGSLFQRHPKWADSWSDIGSRTPCRLPANALVIPSWLIVMCDTAGEVMFARTSRLTT
jgi:hypothetical protein